MTILAGADIDPEDFISTSAGAGDSGKVPKLNGSGILDSSFLKGSLPFVKTIYDLSGSPHTWTKQPGLTMIRVQLWGGGGGAAAATGAGSSAGGGGGGEYIEAFFAASELGSTETITIGAGGARKLVAGAGNAGSNTTFGSLLTAHGGSNGTTGDSGGGNGGSPFTLTNIYGAGGAVGANGLYSGGGSGSTGTSPYDGGKSLYGGGGGAGWDGGGAIGGTSTFGGNGGGAGSDGSVPGGGGGAGRVDTGGYGGAGGNGRCIVTEYYN